MPLYTTTDDVGGITPPDFGALIVQPVMDASVFASVATVVRTNAVEYHVPVVAEDASASWVPEGQDISPSDPVLEELVVTPKKLAGLTIISNELADDSNPSAIQVVGDSLARDVARKLDQAAFAGMSSPAPAGLSTLSGVQTVASGSYSNLDWAAEAQSLAEQVGATITAFVTNPATALTLAKIKTATGSNQPVLGADPTVPTSRSVFGVPLHVSPHVAAGTVWGIDSSRVHLVLRNDVVVEADRSRWFESDRTGVRVIMRVGFGWVHNESVIKVTTS